MAFEVLTKIVQDTLDQDKAEDAIRMDVFREEAEEKLIKGLTQEELTQHFQEIFNAADTDGSGALEFEEFKECLKGSDLGFTEEEISFLGQQADGDRSGTIEYVIYSLLRVLFCWSYLLTVPWLVCLSATVSRSLHH